MTDHTCWLCKGQGHFIQWGQDKTCSQCEGTGQYDPYSDDRMQADTESPFPGTRRIATALLKVPAEARHDIANEAVIQSNVVGGVVSQWMEREVRRYLDGERTYPYTEANRAMIERERATKTATGVFRPEPLPTAFGHLPHHR